MTTYNKTSLAAFFETGDVPTGQNYSDLIDSQVNIVETSAQSMQGSLTTTELITPRVSAFNVNVTNGLSVVGFTANNATVTSALTAGSVSASTITVNGDVSAGGTVYASAVRSGFVLQQAGTVSAAGTTQGAAAILTNVINRGKGIADGVTTGFAPLANRAGLVQYLLNEGASANLWPPTGGTINGLAANAVFPLAASSSFTIFHITASSYGVS